MTIPAVGTTYAIGEELANMDTASDDVQLHVKVDASNEQRSSTNVQADTAGGDPNNVIVIGGHLDSVDEGPGINDNGSGSAFVLEAARAMAAEGIEPVNKVRFSWWGAEESGLVGSHAVRRGDVARGVRGARDEPELRHARLAEPRQVRLRRRLLAHAAAGDGTGRQPRRRPDRADFNEYFASQGIPVEPSAFDGRSDYKPFQDNGIPAGGLFSGAEVAKTPTRRRSWGGMPGVAFDPNYHQPGDTIDNIDRSATSRWRTPRPTCWAPTPATRASRTASRRACGEARATARSRRSWVGTTSADACVRGEGGSGHPLPRMVATLAPVKRLVGLGTGPGLLTAALIAPDAGATVPPKRCGTITVESKRYLIKADQLRCRTARAHARRYLSRRVRPAGYRCTTPSGKTALAFWCSKRVKVFFAIRR